MYNPGSPYIPETNYSRDSMNSPNLIGFSQPSSLTDQQLNSSRHSNLQDPQISQKPVSGTGNSFQYPLHSVTSDAREGFYPTESFQNQTPIPESFNHTAVNQYYQVKSTISQSISTTQNAASFNGLPPTMNVTNSMHKPPLGLSEDNHQSQHSNAKSHLQSPLQPPNTSSTSLPQQNDLYASGNTNVYSNPPHVFGQYNSSLNAPMQSRGTSDYDKVPQSGHTSAREYTSTSQQSPSLVTSNDYHAPSLPSTQAPIQFYNSQQNPAAVLPPHPRTFASGQDAPPPTRAHNLGSVNMDPSVRSPNLYPPPPMHEVHPPLNPIGSTGIPPPLPSVPMPNMSTNYQTYPQQMRSGADNIRQPNIPRHPGYDQNTVFRTPGTAASISDWNNLKTPINLLQERCLLPSDGPDLPPKPMLTTPINCDSDIMRCTLTNVPSNSKLLTRCRLPLGLVMHPFRDLTNLHTIHTTTIVRCRSCRTYINPFVQFMDSGRRWRCPVCFLSNTVPDDFYYDPGTQTYGDPSRRPEIRSATVEFIAPSEYMVRPPQPATYLFCFDVSHNAIATGYLQLACQRLEALISRIPGDSRRQVAFMTFNSSVHYYKLSGETMRMLICPDLEDIFLPDNEGLLNRIDDCTDVLREFLLHLHENFIGTNDTGNCLGSALQAAQKLIGSTGGRITVFNTCLPNIGVGALSLREEPSDRCSVEIKHLNLSTDFYKTFALDCAHQQVAVDMFIFNSQYCDIATISGASRFSSGTIHHYPDFCYSPQIHDALLDNVQSNSTTQTTNATSNNYNKCQFSECVEVERFRRDFDRYLVRKIGFEAVMRIRCTQGLSIQTFHGSCFVRSTDLMSLPNVSPDSGYAVQLDLSESLERCGTVCCQAAVLYTSSKGDRRIRVHTLCLPVVHTPTEVFQGADQGAIACLLSKMAVDRTITSGLSNAREALANAVADALSAYITSCSISPNCSSTTYGLPCPPNLRLLPLYICGLLRFKAFRVGVVTRLDDRSAALERIKSAPPNDLITLMYPKLYAVHRFVSKPLSSHATLVQKAASLRLADHGDEERPSDCDGTSSSGESDANAEAEQLPNQLHLSAQSISRSGVYLLDTGELLLLLVGYGEDVPPGSNNPSDILRQLLGISSPNELPVQGGPFTLPIMNLPSDKQNTLSEDNTSIPVGHRRLSALINLLRRRRPVNNVLVCMRHDAPTTLRSLFLSCMIEDKTESAPSYQEFLQMIQNLLRS
ncbi:unnamed protein product [Trichobilharzia szidati]|nr:unnamed protein product [Trichobilharzia szidati]